MRASASLELPGPEPELRLLPAYSVEQFQEGSMLQVLCVTRGVTLSASSSTPRVTGGLDQIHKVKFPLPELPTSKVTDCWDEGWKYSEWKLWTG